jgi:ABC-2 type transport system ATP-binding protein
VGTVYAVVMDPIIHFRSAVALVGRFPVLAGVDLDVARGETVWLEGPNGAGKTSLLRACAGVLRVAAGEAQVLGEDLVANQRAVRRRVGLSGHATALYDDLSAIDNVRFAVRAWRGSLDAVEPAMNRLGLTGRLPGTVVSSLSAGQRKRVALSILIARDPELWLLDEPHAGLDAEHRDQLDVVIADAAGRGKTVVLASHEAERVSGLAERVVAMAGGVVVPPSVRQAAPTPAEDTGPDPSVPNIEHESRAHVA